MAHPSARSLFACALLSFTLFGVLLYSWTSFDGIPARSTLRSITGTVEWVASKKYDVKFKLRESTSQFSYASIGKATGLVYDALAQAGKPTVSVLYDSSTPSGPIFSDSEYFSVYEVSVNQVVVRSHSDVAAGHQSNAALGPWIASAFLAIGIYLGAYGRKIQSLSTSTRSRLNI